ncbi:MAG: ATP-dependent helicase HrpB [Methylacidiphilales bacterium]|nr:ATP-dependent helicase HrpB [Candidatus Methylacidiphilales bacterium]
MPIYELHDAFQKAYQAGYSIILQSPTGSGKSTQVPQWLAQALQKQTNRFADKIYVLQPRRIAARLLAKRVAEEMQSSLGDRVGYQIRFESNAASHTQILFLTEGVFLRKIKEDPTLSECVAIIFDEFHERYIETDLALALARRLKTTTRPDLRLIVMSATLSTTALEAYLPQALVLRSQGRIFPVRIEYLSKPFVSSMNYSLADLTAEEAERLLNEEKDGGLLIFMPTVFDVQRTLHALHRRLSSREFVLLPLHGELHPDEQDAAIRRYPQRKVIVATNVAETSITVEDIRLVIDSGLARKAKYDPTRGINTLLIESIAQASADQRAGRAGRVAPGRCLRLWTESEHRSRPQYELPEIHRVDLAESLLFLASQGIQDVEAFSWYESPKTESVKKRMQLLYDLGAVDDKGQITALGRRMAAFPVHPRFSRMLISAETKRCVRPILNIIALAQGKPVLQRVQGRDREKQEEILKEGEDRSDWFVALRALRVAQEHQFEPQICSRYGINSNAAREVTRIQIQLLDIARSLGIEVESESADSESILRCILVGFPDNVAQRRDQGTLRCRLVHQRSGELSRLSVVRSWLFVASEIREINQRKGGEVMTILSFATAVTVEALMEEFPHALRTEQQCLYDETLRRVVAKEVCYYHDLVLSEKILEDVPLDEAATLLAEKILDGSLILKHWDDSVEQWIARLNWLARQMPELGLKPIDSEARKSLLKMFCHGAVSYKEIKNKPVTPLLSEWLSASEADCLERLAPRELLTQNGKRLKLRYSEGKPPRVTARIQDLYDLKDRILIAGQRVVFEIQAPNFRPIQVTDDLETFWREHYPKIKAELQRVYPKHEWR